ncbi:MAG: hypothetical protein QY325_00065 [Flavobacteriales bacterium]|nr:MAG: hypothetical protein QY325_00065 [Flavobacteriales bacterium]
MTRHLPTLSILHYVYGALTCLGGAAVLVLVFMGLLLNSGSLPADGDPPPAWVGQLMQGLGWGLFALIEAIGVLVILSGRWIARRTNRTGSLVAAALCCLNFPLGMALGVFTFVALLDPAVRAEYDAAAPRA